MKKLKMLLMVLILILGSGCGQVKTRNTHYNDVIKDANKLIIDVENKVETLEEGN